MEGAITQRNTPWLRSPDNPEGLEVNEALEKLLGELSLKQMQDPTRERSLVITYLETALCWEVRRMCIKGEAFISETH